MNLVFLALMSVGQLYCEAPASVTYYSGAHPDQVGVTYYHETPPVYAEVPLLWSQPNSAAVPVHDVGGFPLASGPGQWYYCPHHNRWTNWQQVVTSSGQVAYRVGGSMPGVAYGGSTPYVQSAPVGRQMQRYGLFGRRIITRTVTPRARMYAPAYLPQQSYGKWSSICRHPSQPWNQPSYNYSGASAGWGNSTGGCCN